MSTQISPNNVVGRDHLIKQIWRLLERQSIVFTAERRIGKTTVLKKMCAEPPSDILVRYLDLEKVDSPRRFVEVLLSTVQDLLPRAETARTAFRGLLESLGGTEIGGIIKLPDLEQQGWQSAMERTIACVCQECADATLLFLFDELPYMLQKVAVREHQEDTHDNAALAILDSMRAMRNEHENLRMVYCGSVGLHHVIESLKKAGYASQPTNDMEKVPIGPLSSQDSLALSLRLLEAEGLSAENIDTIAAIIALKADFVPFYIERIITRLAMNGNSLTIESVESWSGFLDH
ncbi:MAG: hypothetical protein ACI8W8_003007 [Rhodothermales bacterium]|jgi:hypothetical protein